MWMKNTSGRPDAVLTMSFMGFVAVLVKFLANGFTMELAGKTFQLGTIDAASIAAILTPTLGAYVARRYTDKKYPDPIVERE